jgi:hypothetical protein
MPEDGNLPHYLVGLVIVHAGASQGLYLLRMNVEDYPDWNSNPGSKRLKAVHPPPPQ